MLTHFITSQNTLHISTLCINEISLARAYTRKFAADTFSHFWCDVKTQKNNNKGVCSLAKLFLPPSAKWCEKIEREFWEPLVEFCWLVCVQTWVFLCERVSTIFLFSLPNFPLSQTLSNKKEGWERRLDWLCDETKSKISRFNFSLASVQRKISGMKRKKLLQQNLLKLFIYFRHSCKGRKVKNFFESSFLSLSLSCLFVCLCIQFCHRFNHHDKVFQPFTHNNNTN